MTFPDFYKAYPRHVGRLDAEKAYNAALKKGATHDQLLGGARAFASLAVQRGTDKSFLPYPASWLRAGHYLDEEFPTSPSKPDLLSAHPTPTSWNTTAPKLIAEIGEAHWQAWFASTELEQGPPLTILCSKPFQAKWIREKYAMKLERILGVNEVRVEVRA